MESALMIAVVIHDGDSLIAESYAATPPYSVKDSLIDGLPIIMILLVVFLFRPRFGG